MQNGMATVATLSTDNIDFADVPTVVGAGRYLLVQLHCAGGAGARVGGESADALRRLRHFASGVERMLPQAGAADLLSLLPLYDMSFRIANNRLPAPGLLDTCRRRVIDARAHGDRRVPHSRVASMLQPLLGREPMRYGAAVLSYYTSLIDSWCRELSRGNAFHGAPTAATYERLTVLLRENLFAYYPSGERTAKFRWVEAGTGMDIHALATPTLTAYRQFLLTARDSYIDPVRFRQADAAALAELALRPDLNPFEREAYRISLDYAAKVS